MNKTKLFVFLLLLLSSLTIVNATRFNETHPNSPPTTLITDTVDRGMNITIRNESFNLEKIYLNPAATATKVYIYNGRSAANTKDQIYVSTSCSGGVCSFNGGTYNLSLNGRYYVLPSKDGASHDEYYKTPITDNQNKSHIKWTKSVYYNSGTWQNVNGYLMEIKSIQGNNSFSSPPATNQTPTPTSLTNTSNGKTNITLSWSGNYGSKYLIFQNGTNVINATSSPYTRTGLTNNTRYSFKIKAYNVSYTTALSNFSNQIEVRTRQTRQTPAPTGLTNTSNGITNITLSWSGNYGSKYLIFQNGTNVINATSSPYVRTGLTNNTRYSFKIKAYNTTYDTVLSPFSNQIEVRTKQSVFVPPPVFVYPKYFLIKANNSLGVPLTNFNATIGKRLKTYGTTSGKILAPFFIIEDYLDYWKFDLPKRDESNLRNLSVTGATQTTSCLFNSCYSFDGVNDYLNVTPFVPTSLSLTGWFKFNERNPDGQAIIGQWAEAGGQAFIVSLWANTSINKNPRLRARVSENGLDTDMKDYIYKNNLTAGRWYFFAMTFNNTAGRFKLYLNNESSNVTLGVANTSMSGIANVGAKTTIGAYLLTAGTTPTGFFNGSLDEIRFYNRSLTDREVQWIYTDRDLNKVFNVTAYTSTSSKSASNFNFTAQNLSLKLDDTVAMNLYTDIINGYNYSSNPFVLKFNATVGGGHNLSADCSFGAFGTKKVSDITVNHAFNFSTTGYEGGSTTLIPIICSNNESRSNINRTVTIDTVSPAITVTRLTNNSAYFIGFTSSIEYDVSLYDQRLYAVNYTLCNITGGGFCNSVITNFYFKNPVVSGVDYNFTETYPVPSTLPLGSYKAMITGWDKQTFHQTKKYYYFTVESADYNFNVNIYDEESPTHLLPADVEIDFSYYAGNDTENLTYFRNAFSDVSTFGINITANQSIVRGNLYIKYTTANGFTHRYIISNTSFNATAGYNFTIYNFNKTTGISGLKITARQNANYNYYPNVIGKLQRKYVSEGVWRTVQMDQSGDFGLLYYNIREKDTDYRLIFTDLNNCVLHMTDSLKFVCTDALCDLTTLLSPCSAVTSETVVTTGFEYFNSTRLLNFTWEDTTAGTSSVRMYARKSTPLGYSTACDNTQTGSAGTFSCNMTGLTGVYEVFVVANGDAILTGYIDIKSGQIGENIDEKEGAFWAVMIIVLCVTFGLFSPVAAMIMMVFGLIVVYLLGIFAPLTLTIIIVATVISIVIGFKVRS